MSRMADAARRDDVRTPEIVIAAVLSMFAFTATIVAPQDDLGGHPWFVVLAMTISPLPLLFMRRHAVAAFCSVLGIELVVQFFGGTEVSLLFAPMAVLPVATYALGAYVDAPRTYWLAATVPIVVAVVNLTGEDSRSTGDFVFPSLVFLAGWSVGRLVHGRTQIARRLEQQTAQLELERDELAQAAVARERARIAREVHDVVAHSVSAMVIQASAARRVLPRSPEASAEALRTVQSVGREALGELRRTLGFLRLDPAAPLQPAPSIARVAELADRAREAGLQVDLRVEGPSGPLPSSTDLAAYRIVQESLTNTLKHAPGAHATVLLRWDPDALIIDIRDTGRGVPAAGAQVPSSGHGLVGMRERAILAGGELTTGPLRNGGFQVRARLPRTAPEPAAGAPSYTEAQEAQPA